MISLIVATTVVLTRVYEYTILSEQKVQPVVKPGYKVFSKETNGFTFHYPVTWSYKSELNEPDFTDGYLVDDSGEKKFYLEVPYSGHSFVVRTENTKIWYAPTVFDRQFMVQVVSSTNFKANDPVTSIVFNIYRPCASVSTTACVPAKTGGFLAAYWQRGKDLPILSVNNMSAQTGVIYHELDRDEPENASINKLKDIISTLNFNDPNEVASSTFLRPKIYYNNAKDYLIHFPADFSLKENSDLSYVFMATGTAIDFPKEFTTGTNLSEARVLLGYVEPQYAGNDCLPTDNISSPSEPMTLNGVIFNKSVGAGAAAGNRFDTITLGTRRSDGCFNATLFLHSTVLENYPLELRPKAFDREKVLQHFYQIVDSLVFDVQ